MSDETRQPYRTRLSARLISGLLLVVMSGAILSTAVFPRFGDLHRAAIWGLVLLVSFAGWGTAVGWLAFREWRADPGLRMSWGMAALVAVGGVACLASMATRAVLLLLVVVGVVIECHDLGRRGRWTFLPATRGGLVAATVVSIVVALLVGIQYYGGAAGARLSSNDDFTAYLAYPEEILATGTLVEPFSVRRLAAYGGQSLLHALTLIGAGDVTQVPLLDMGICLIAVLALVVGHERRAAGWWVLPVLLVLTLPNVRYNSTSHMSGVVFFLALFRTVAWPGFETHPLRGRAVVGMLAAAAGTLRQSYLVGAVVFLLVLEAPGVLSTLRLPGAERRRRLAAAAIAPAAMLACLLPWALLTYRSSGTPLFPLIHGNYRAEYGQLTAANAVMDRATWLWVNLRHCHPVRSIPLFLLAALLWPWRQARGALAALTWASVLGFIAIVYGFPQSDEWNMSRYYFAFVVSTMLAVTLEVGSLSSWAWRSISGRQAAAVLLVLTAVVYQLQGVVASSYENYQELVATIRQTTRRQLALPDEVRPYRALQSSIPVGAPVLAMLDRPFWLDFGRNPIDLIDLPAHASPPPGMPLDDDEALAAYLMQQGLRYLAFVRPTVAESLYRRKRWERLSEPDSSGLWREAAPFYLKVFDRFEELMASRARVYDDTKMVVLDLATRVH